MNKMKKIWNENKILFVLGIILIICLVIVLVVTLIYFYGSSDSVYGPRLDATQNVPMTDAKLKEMQEKLTSNESVSTATVILKGKIIYISVDYVLDTKMDDAKKISESVLELLSEDELAVYDLQFTIHASLKDDASGYTLMGARNSNGKEEIVWNNYNIKEESNEN